MVGYMWSKSEHDFPQDTEATGKLGMVLPKLGDFFDKLPLTGGDKPRHYKWSSTEQVGWVSPYLGLGLLEQGKFWSTWDG